LDSSGHIGNNPDEYNLKDLGVGEGRLGAERRWPNHKGYLL